MVRIIAVRRKGCIVEVDIFELYTGQKKNNHEMFLGTTTLYPGRIDASPSAGPVPDAAGEREERVGRSGPRLLEEQEQGSRRSGRKIKPRRRRYGIRGDDARAHVRVATFPYVVHIKIVFFSKHFLYVEQVVISWGAARARRRGLRHVSAVPRAASKGIICHSNMVIYSYFMSYFFQQIEVQMLFCSFSRSCWWRAN